MIFTAITFLILTFWILHSISTGRNSTLRWHPFHYFWQCSTSHKLDCGERFSRDPKYTLSTWKCKEVYFIITGLSTLRNSTLLIRLSGTVSNGLDARQFDIFTKVLLKASLKLLKSIRFWYRNVTRFQN